MFLLSVQHDRTHIKIFSRSSFVVGSVFSVVEKLFQDDRNPGPRPFPPSHDTQSSFWAFQDLECSRLDSKIKVTFPVQRCYSHSRVLHLTFQQRRLFGRTADAMLQTLWQRIESFADPKVHAFLKLLTAWKWSKSTTIRRIKEKEVYFLRRQNHGHNKWKVAWCLEALTLRRSIVPATTQLGWRFTPVLS